MHVLGSFIFGLPSDRADTFAATAALAKQAGLTFAQFVMMTPFPGTVDFDRWEKSMNGNVPQVDGVPITRYWLIPAECAAEDVHSPRDHDDGGDLASGRRGSGTTFTACGRFGTGRSACPRCAAGWRSCSSPSCIARCMRTPAFPPTAPGGRRRRAWRAGWRCRAESYSQRKPMPELEMPAFTQVLGVDFDYVLSPTGPARPSQPRLLLQHGEAADRVPKRTAHKDVRQ